MDGVAVEENVQAACDNGEDVEEGMGKVLEATKDAGNNVEGVEEGTVEAKKATEDAGNMNSKDNGEGLAEGV